MGRTALITGVTGQDGSYLAEYLLEKDYDVHGLVRQNSCPKMENIDKIKDLITFHHGDITDYQRLCDIIQKVKPKEIYNLAAMTQVGKSFINPLYTAEVNALGAHKLFHAAFSINSKVRIYQASTSEMFGDVDTEVQNEVTRFNPVSPYAVSKLYAHKTACSYRRRGYFISCGILFNHESPRRHEYFVTRKIAKGVVDFVENFLASGCKNKISLGNLDAQRDWGYAPDYIKGMHLMMQQKKPDDFILATGKSHTVRDFCTEAFKVASIPITWWGHGLEEKGVLADGTTVVEVNKEFYRPNEVGRLCGDATKALKLLGWEPEVSFYKLVEIMIKKELENE